MRVSVGIFDVFTYAIPGSLYLAFGFYIAVRLDWIEVGRLADVPVILLIGGIVIISYLLGHFTYVFGSLVDRVFPFWRRTGDDARREFLRRVPAAQGRAYVRADGSVILSGIEMRDKEAAQEISRLRATGLMVRNCCVPLLAGCVAAVVEAFIGADEPVAIVCAVLLGLSGVAASRDNQILRHWASLKTLETAFWMPEIEERFRPAEPRPLPPPRRRRLARRLRFPRR